MLKQSGALRLGVQKTEYKIMNHARALMASAIASVLAACGGGGGGDAPNASSPVSAGSSATSSAASNTATTVTTPAAGGTSTGATNAAPASSGSLAAAKLAVEQSAAEAATARRAAADAQALAAAERAAAETARRQAAAAAEQAAAADVQNKAAAEQAAQQAAERHAALTQKLAATEAEVKRAEGVVRAQAARLQALERQAAAAAKDEAQKQAAGNASNVEAPAIPECSGNALPVTDKETGLLLVCESQITEGATKTEVGATKHASGRYYALPFPDKSMMVTGSADSYKLACGTTVCEWSKVDGSMDIVYAAVGKDGKTYRFESCREGEQKRLICQVPHTGLPDGVEAIVDDREPQAPRVGAEITDTDTSGKNGFRAKAETSRPMRCPADDVNAAAFPWPNKDLFKQQENGTWKAVFDGGNCLGDVRVITDNPEAPTRTTFAASAAAWTLDVNGPDGKALTARGCSLQRAVEPDEVGSVADALRADPASGFGECQFGAAQADGPVTQPEQPATPSNPQPELQQPEQTQQDAQAGNSQPASQAEQSRQQTTEVTAQQPASQPQPSQQQQGENQAQQQSQQGESQQTTADADAANRARAEEEAKAKAEAEARARAEEQARAEAEAQQAREREAAEAAERERAAAEAERVRAEQARAEAAAREQAAAEQARAAAQAQAQAEANAAANANAAAPQPAGNGADASAGAEQATPDARGEGGEAAAAANRGPATFAGQAQQQTRSSAVDTAARGDDEAAFPWSGDGSTVTYGGRQITTTIQPNGDITYRTSAGEVPFNRALDASGNVLTTVVGCNEVNGGAAQECTFKAAS